jgi:hypothetical protein
MAHYDHKLLPFLLRGIYPKFSFRSFLRMRILAHKADHQYKQNEYREHAELTNKYCARGSQILSLPKLIMGRYEDDLCPMDEFFSIH